MEAPCDLADIIQDIIQDLNIPTEYHLKALLEGHRAYHENRDIEMALRYWWDSIS